MKIYEHPDIAGLVPLAEAGDAKAQYELADKILHDDLEGIDWKNDAKNHEALAGLDWSDEELAICNACELLAIEWLLPAAKQGYIAAQELLGDTYYNQDKDAQAFHWWASASQGGSTDALAEIGKFYIYGFSSLGGPEKDLYNGIRFLRKAAEKGSETAWYFLTRDFDPSQYVGRHYSEADIERKQGRAHCLNELLRSENADVRLKANDAVDKLSEDGRKELQRYLDNDINVTEGSFLPPNPHTDSDAPLCFFPDREKYDRDALLIANLHARIHNEQNFTHSLGKDAPYWIELPAQAGDFRYQYILGDYFNPDNPDSIAHDFDKSYYWFTKAAKQGYKPAIKWLLALCEDFQEREECAKDIFFWANKLLEIEDVDAYFWLEKCYEKGWGTAKDITRIVPLMESVLSSDTPKVSKRKLAAKRLYECYRDGFGVEKDVEKASIYHAMTEDSANAVTKDS